MNDKKMRVHPSSKCSKCGKSQEDGVQIFDYYHVGEGVFCTECRTPVTDSKEQKKLPASISMVNFTVLIN